MANTKREKLFAEFPPVPTEKWEEVIAVDLKGADYERKLVWADTRRVQRPAVLSRRKPRRSQIPRLRTGEFPYVRGTAVRQCVARAQSLTVKCPEAANAEALKLLDSGVDSLGFSFTKGLSAARGRRRCCATSTCLPSKWSFRRGRRGRRGTRIGEDRKGGLAGDRFPCTSCSIRSSTVCRSPARSARPAGEKCFKMLAGSGAPYGRDEGCARGDGVG